MTDTLSSTSGYNCDRCGAWIGEAMTHSCSGARSIYVEPVWTVEDKARLFRTLDRIVELLERSVGVRR